MKKELCTLTKDEFWEISSLLSNIYSLQTVNQVLRESGDMSPELEKRCLAAIRHKTMLINNAFEKITDKYNLTYYPLASLDLSPIDRKLYLVED